ncbi:AI-2E family transporter [Marivivens niveibacter]|uniref:AI-2E family transporter n=1 Tax=Marivivens niveibacter TaxID=1930667 RepID=A0A251X2V2_9RHOB|nr:AI-2E family transporter [Marivivens niveibacter]OUD10936.1 AI-2E family transporter [Marivivens niveibacter]
MTNDPIPTTNQARVQTAALVIIAAAMVLFLLVQAQFMMIALAVAIILFSLTSDVIQFIARQSVGPFRIPNWIASIAALLLISTALLTLSSILLTQVNTVISLTLEYAERAPSAIAQLFSFMGEDVESAIFSAIAGIEFSGYLQTLAGQAGNVTSFTVLVILFVGFLFAERIWFETKLGNLVADPIKAARIARITQSIIHRVNYYLLVKTLISVATGGLVYFLATWFGLELAAALGILTFVLNYIPNVGSLVATLLIALVAYIQTEDPSVTWIVFGITSVIQFSMGNVIEPMLMGRALRLSSFGIIISLAFWGAVWGVPGMFLSVPIMVMMMVICSHVPNLRPVAVLLSREGLPDTEQDL